MSTHARTSHPSLQKLRLPELQARYREVVGEATRSPNRTWLIRRIEEALAARGRPQPKEKEQAPGKSGRGPKGRTKAQKKEEQAEAPAPESSTPKADEAPLNATPAPASPTPKSAPTVGSSAEPASNEGPPAAKPPRGRFAAMTVEQLQAKYLEVVGRQTGSDDRRYLIWKIREAEKGRINIGSRKTRARGGEPLDVKILPLRLEAEVADKMDEAWRSQGIKNRMEFFRGAIGHYLAHLGAHDAAALFANAGATGS
ncbi:DUF2924 domain-containing protein [Corallococcus exiguus]|uniref:DUF2924 domain-containing protein n=1 Tax=Corallococcus exiguus TaxID=83462 RepID=UPI0014709075|nr:DUF2924 domain-containing protein [Corallococcus exiguus]NNB92451.1 DUF2924 domain-containing protein [Corallococcus exiguus]NNC01269.1 DUF2924 domain-containing protein [Corallococcus exiguus]